MRRAKHVLGWGVSRLVAGLSDQFLLFAIPILLYRKTGDIALSGAAYVIEWIPRLLSPLLSGVFVDAFCSRRVAIVSDGIRCVLCLLAFATIVLFPEAPFWLYAVIAGAIGLFYETSFLAFDVSLSRTSDTEELPKVQSRIQSAEQIAFICGPALAVAAVTVTGLETLFLVASGLFAVAAATTSLTDPVGSVSELGSAGTAMRSIGAGYAQIVRQPLLRKLTLLCFMQNVALGLCLSLSPGYLQANLGLKESAFGMLTMIAGLASLALFLLLPSILKRTGVWRLCAATVVASPAALALMGSSTHPLPYFVGFALLAVVDGCLGIVLRTTRATVVPSENLGSVVSAMIFFLNVAFPLGGALLGLFIPWLGGRALLLALAGVWALTLGILLKGLEEHFRDGEGDGLEYRRAHAP